MGGTEAIERVIKEQLNGGHRSNRTGETEAPEQLRQQQQNRQCKAAYPQPVNLFLLTVVW